MLEGNCQGGLYSPSCREGLFSETRFVPLLILGSPILLILGSPIYRGNSMRSGLGLCTNAQTTFRCRGFSETQLSPGPIELAPYVTDRGYRSIAASGAYWKLGFRLTQFSE